MDRKDVRLFYDEYKEGKGDYYILTWGELVDNFGEEQAQRIWKYGQDCGDIKPTVFDNWGLLLYYDELENSYQFDD